MRIDLIGAFLLLCVFLILPVWTLTRYSRRRRRERQATDAYWDSILQARRVREAREDRRRRRHQGMGAMVLLMWSVGVALGTIAVGTTQSGCALFLPVKDQAPIDQVTQLEREVNTLFNSMVLLHKNKLVSDQTLFHVNDELRPAVRGFLASLRKDVEAGRGLDGNVYYNAILSAIDEMSLIKTAAEDSPHGDARSIRPPVGDLPNDLRRGSGDQPVVAGDPQRAGPRAPLHTGGDGAD